MDEHWTDFERALMAMLERIAVALETKPINITINNPDAVTTPAPSPFYPWVNT